MERDILLALADKLDARGNIWQLASGFRETAASLRDPDVLADVLPELRASVRDVCEGNADFAGMDEADRAEVLAELYLTRSDILRAIADITALRTR